MAPTQCGPLVARDLFGAAGVGVVACALFLSTFSAHVALGDAPESVAGVRTLGILHAPGYAAYVLAARLFATILPLGSWALRVNLFSLVCASLAVACVHLVARAVGARPAGAAIGALALATTASFWLNAGFAKYYSFTALLLAGSVLAVLVWQERGGTTWFVLAAALLAVALGAGWQLAAIAAVSLAVLVALGPRRPNIDESVIAGGVFIVISGALVLFALIRAHQDPTLNWGGATNAGRLVHMLSRRDFQSVAGARSGLNAVLLRRLGALTGGLVRDFGAGAIVLGVIGAVRAARLGRARVLFLVLAAVLDLVSVFVGAGINDLAGFWSVLTQGGYLLLTMIVIAVLVALGATEVGDRLAMGLERRRATTADSSPRSGSSNANVATGVTAAVLAVAVLLPSVLVHREHANLRVQPYADQYAQEVLDALPQHAALLVWGQEYSMPMLYRQLVDHQRPDVLVISANDVGLDWGREQLARRLHLGTDLDQASVVDSVRVLAKDLRRTRPVYLDTTAMYYLATVLGYETRGLVGKLVDDGVSAFKINDVDAVAASMRAGDRTAGVDAPANLRIPFFNAYLFRSRAHVELAKVYALVHNRGAMLRELRIAVRMFPLDPRPQAALRRLGGSATVDPLPIMRTL